VIYFAANFYKNFFPINEFLETYFLFSNKTVSTTEIM